MSEESMFATLDDLPLGWDVLACCGDDRDGALRLCRDERQRGRKCFVVPTPEHGHFPETFAVWEEPNFTKCPR